MTGTLYIRADASPEMGIGHITRCLALSQAWQDRGGSVCFMSCGLNSKLAAKLTSRDIRICPVDSPWPHPADLTQTLAHIAGKNRSDRDPASWVVLDGYHFDTEFQAGIRAAGHRVLVVDDANHLDEYQADILVNQNLSGCRYPYKTPRDCRILAGSRYLMLRREFTREAPEKLSAQGSIRVLVTMGGSDPGRATPAIVRALLSLNRPDLRIKIVIGPASPHADEIQAAVPSGAGFIEILTDPDMAGLMAWADLGITAGGSTCWELCAMGVPFMVFPVADNQTDIAESLAHRIGAVNAGPPDRLSGDDLAGLIKRFIDDTARHSVISSSGRGLADGKGAMRIVREMTASPAPGSSPASSGPPSLSPKKITIVSDSASWLNAFLPGLVSRLQDLGHQVEWRHDIRDMAPSDMAFYLSCGQIVPRDILKKNAHNLVVHGSALPQGRGWSPISWQILEGRNAIPLTLFEASERVDTGPVYLQRIMSFRGTELLPEIQEETARMTIEICLAFMEDYPRLTASAWMPGGTESIYPRRTPKDSKLDPDRSIREQFNLLRIADNDNYPAFFTLGGRTYKLAVTPMGEAPDED